MRSKEEFSAAIQHAMKDKNIGAEELRRKLDVSEVMLKKIISGEVVPSAHLEKELIEVLSIEPNLVKRLARLRQDSELRKQVNVPRSDKPTAQERKQNAGLFTRLKVFAAE